MQTQAVFRSNVTDAQRGAGETGSAASQVLSAAQSLSRDSNRRKLGSRKIPRYGTRCLTGQLSAISVDLRTRRGINVNRVLAD